LDILSVLCLVLEFTKSSIKQIERFIVLCNIDRYNNITDQKYYIVINDLKELASGSNFGEFPVTTLSCIHALYFRGCYIISIIIPYDNKEHIMIHNKYYSYKYDCDISVYHTNMIIVDMDTCDLYPLYYLYNYIILGIQLSKLLINDIFISKTDFEKYVTSGLDDIQYNKLIDVITEFG
jgi:hypothetical protein